ncbi:MAG: hypothetical protein ACREBC_34945 [Pyrinomonadaceae bacterium]
MKRRFYALPAFLVASVWLVTSSVAEQGVTADVCPQKLATIQRLKNELQIEHAAIQRNEVLLEQQKKDRVKAGEAQTATYLAHEAKPGYSWLTNVGNRAAVAAVENSGKTVGATEALLKRNREKEACLAKELALEESLAARCLQQSAAAAATKPAFPNIAGAYNSPYGHTVLTQTQQSDTAAHVEGTVHYDKSANTPEGGTSKLQGSFDGRTWNYTWRNSYGHNGEGQLTLLDDGTGMKGWWIDKRPSPPQRGNWWLYRK